ncbi:hypothetical protein [Pectobacterium brasiliense]|uniref:hypothetical protein n=1 Tax=Pectobacterium brasiliense TaxID=180957 RepID=UPI0004E6B289|nr:hypothetical protein [Pectobacterium brasiliense]KFF69284.1 hypothetical protein IW00_06335 [Pectobacterium brasiliense]
MAVSKMAATKKWLKNNWFSLFASTMAFVLSTAVNQGIDWLIADNIGRSFKQAILHWADLSASTAERKNTTRLARRGKLLPDWTRAEPWDSEEFLLPFAGPSGKIYHYQIVSCRNDN